MEQKVILNVKSVEPFSHLKDNQILVYDKQNKVYYVDCINNLLSAQNYKIKQLEEKVQLLEQNINNFTNNITEQKKMFLQTYKETNSKIIEMVKTSIQNKEN